VATLREVIKSHRRRGGPGADDLSASMQAEESPDVDRRARPGDEPGRAADSSAEQAQHTEARQTSGSAARESERDASARGAAGADAPRGRVLQLFAAMHSPPGADLARRAAAPLHAAASGAMHSGRKPHSAQRNSQRATAVLQDPHMLPPLAPQGGAPKPPPRAGAPPPLAGLSPIAEARERSAQLSFSLSPSPAPPASCAASASRAASPAQPAHRWAGHGSSRGSAASTLEAPLGSPAPGPGAPPSTPADDAADSSLRSARVSGASPARLDLSIRSSGGGANCTSEIMV